MSKIRLSALASSYISEKTLLGIKNIEIESSESNNLNQITVNSIEQGKQSHHTKPSQNKPKEQIEIGFTVSKVEATFKADGLITVLLKRFVIACIIALVTSIITLLTGFLN